MSDIRFYSSVKSDCSAFGCQNFYVTTNEYFGSGGHSAAHYRYLLKDMCDRGVDAWEHRKEPTTLKFECFNRPEAEEVETYMREKHPGVPFFTTWLTWPRR